MDADSFEVIQKKIEFLANSKNIVTPRSKGSDKKKKSESSDGSQTVLPVLGSSTMFNMVILRKQTCFFYAKHHIDMYFTYIIAGLYC